tara:strand:+ start:6404 stop:6835 length:432 start_codon:yes stop_codon:yes gene_type:complete
MFLYFLSAIGFGATFAVGGWVAWDWYNNRNADEQEESVPVLSYYHDNEILEHPQAGIKYLVGDDQGIDAQETWNAVSEWIREDDPNIFTGEWSLTVTSYNDSGVIEIAGDASTLIRERYENVELPYVDNDSNLYLATVDLDFS